MELIAGVQLPCSSLRSPRFGSHVKRVVKRIPPEDMILGPSRSEYVGGIMFLDVW